MLKIAVDYFVNRVYTVIVQLLDKETINPANEIVNQATPSDCATQLVEVTPIIMRHIQNEMRRRTRPDLTVAQYRTLNYIKVHPKASLSDVAAHLGLTLPSTSKLVQHLVEQKVVTRRGAADRRRVSLSLTQQGTTALDAARLETQQQLAESLSSLSPRKLSAVSAALRILNKAFSGGSPGVNIR
jgi:DNA-binding MarR family transcriptional regulator